MPTESTAAGGPLKSLEAFGGSLPYYVLRFDKDGNCVSPETLEHLIRALDGDHTDLLLYSHGWNNDFPTSTALYDGFISGLSGMAATHSLLPRPFKPVFVGLAWPSTALTFGAEDGPEIAGIGASDPELDALLSAVPPGSRQEAAEILQGPQGVDAEAARKLAGLVAASLDRGSDSEAGARSPDADEILVSWRIASANNDGGAEGFTDFGTGDGEAADPRAAGFFDRLDPRWIVRLATVLIMKDRAGLVGANGAADVVNRILAETGVRLFLVGHSYGAKVVMTALAARAPARPVDGALLLQPAVSRLCFAVDRGDGLEGGFVRALNRVRQPIFLTHSRRDLPLRRLFHLAARRGTDAGELQMAGEPSRFAALGGYGAARCRPGQCLELELPGAGNWPDAVGPAVRVVSLDGSRAIGGHGDVNRAETSWAMLNLLK